MTKTILRVCLTAAITAFTVSAASVSLTLDPASGTVSGLPGDTVGWGYSIVNDTSDYVVIANSYFCEPGQDPLFTTCTSSLGAYSDLIAGNGTVIAPGDTATQSFDTAAATGIGQYGISNSAIAGQTDIGSIALVYDLFDNNPFDGPATQIGGDEETFADATVMVTGAATAAPEPQAWTLLLLGLFGFVAVRRRFQRQSPCKAKAAQ